MQTTRRSFSLLELTMLLLFSFLAIASLSPPVHANHTITVSTAYGDVLGYQTDTARIFYGIPFAEPPLNDLR